MIATQTLAKTYSGRHGDIAALRHADMTIATGESIAVVGPSGSGKSTFLQVLGTLDRPTAGRVLYDGVDPYTMTDAELARFRNAHIGFVFQDHHLLPEFSALENTMMPALIAGDSDAAAADKARTILDRVGLSHRLHHRPVELSGGENQRVAVARAAVLSPPVILADEPTGNLDADTSRGVEEMLLDLSAAHGMTLVVVTHSPALADRLDRRVHIAAGVIQGADA